MHLSYILREITRLVRIWDSFWLLINGSKYENILQEIMKMDTYQDRKTLNVKTIKSTKPVTRVKKISAKCKK